MFFTLPMIFIAIYAVAALLPAYLLLRYIYHKDTIEKEPRQLLVSLLVRGILAALLAGVIESVTSRILGALVPSGTGLYTILLAFLVVAAAEEGTKFLLLKKRTWTDPNFNYRFDAIVYSVFVSLGFAAFENLQYIFSYGLSVAIPRAIFAIPGHMSFAVFMGSFYGQAKLCERNGDPAGCQRNLRTGYILAVLFHGFYDSCAMTGSGGSTAIFIIFVVIMYVNVRRIIQRESASDQPI